jgi:hypothetical protein
MDEMKNAFEQAIEEACLEISRPDLSPQGALKKTLERSREWAHVHPAKAEQAAGIVREFKRAALEALERFDYAAVSKAIDSFHHNMRFSGLSMPPVEPSQKDKWAPAMLRYGWSGWDIDTFFTHYLKSGQKVGKVTWEGATIGERTVTRAGMRLAAKPKTSPVSDADWINQWGPIRRVVRREDGQEVFQD